MEHFLRKLIFSTSFVLTLCIGSCNAKKETKTDNSISTIENTETSTKPAIAFPTKMPDMMFDGEIDGKAIKMMLNTETDSDQTSIIVAGNYYFVAEGEDNKRILNGYISNTTEGSIALSEQQNGYFVFEGTDDAKGTKFLEFLLKKTDTYQSCSKTNQDQKQKLSVILRHSK
jgi:hypothetical protein